MAEYYDKVDATNFPAYIDSQAEENKVVNKGLTALPEPYLSGMKLRADVEINGLKLNTIDENNVVWVVTEIDGWWNLPDPEIPDLPRGWGDGSYDAIGRYANRLITLSGSFLVQKPEDAAVARNTLLEAINLVKTGGWLIVDEGPDGLRKGANVRLSGRPIVTNVNPRGRHDFSIGFKAVDPIKYEFVDSDPNGYQYKDITSDSSGLAEDTITNSGNTPVPVVIELPFDFTIPDENSLPYINNGTSDQRITIVGGTSADKKLELDTYNREVLEVQYSGGSVINVANGRSKVAVLVDWIYLNPGENTLQLVNFPANSTVRIFYRSGWIG